MSRHKPHSLWGSGWSSIVLSLILLASCSESLEREQVTDSTIRMDITAAGRQVRTTLDGTTLSWASGDIIGVYMEGLYGNIPFFYNSDGTFVGYVPKKGVTPSSRKMYSYFPHTVQAGGYVSGAEVTGCLPATQTAPFDPKADYMVSDVTTVEYDEDNLPKPNLVYGNHLFSIVRIDITNSSAALAGELLDGIRIESASRILSGVFTFDVTEGVSANATFSDNGQETYKSVNALFPSGTPIGEGKRHTVQVVIPAGTYPEGDLTVTVFLGDRMGSVTSKTSMTFERSSVHELQTIDVASLNLEKRYRTMLVFGDSITTRTVSDCLQELLGPMWKVYLAGKTSEKVLQIMCRTGAAPLYIKGAFTIPASSAEAVAVGSSFWSDLQTNGDRSAVPDIAVNVDLAAYSPTDRSTYCGLTNPFLINGVECTVSLASSVLSVKRVRDGEEVKCEGPYTLAIPYAKWKLGNPDILSVYMGTNGTYTANAATGRTTNQVLADFYHMVRNSTSGKFIAVGYHHSFWNASYRDTFTQEFTIGGKCCYLDLRTDGCKYAEAIAAQEGYPLTEEDMDNISRNIWPATWGGLDIHPYTPVGGRAHAYCIYYKMKELGFLDL